MKIYLDSGDTSDAFWVLLNRINANYVKLNEDIELIKLVREKRKS